jgi:hypothetical protein
MSAKNFNALRNEYGWQADVVDTLSGYTKLRVIRAVNGPEPTFWRGRQFLPLDKVAAEAGPAPEHIA